MRLWSFLFTTSEVLGVNVPYQSARVLAPTKDEARLLLDATIGLGILDHGSILCQYAGEIKGNETGVVMLIWRNGTIKNFKNGKVLTP